jgi:uncharacterized protein
MSATSKRSYAVAILAGVLFSLGLGISGMTQQVKVLSFLDLAGAWDPSLALVMVSAIGVHAIARRFVHRRNAPLFGDRFLPQARDLDGKLLAGAALFGIGWGLGGFCPGPGLVSLVSGAAPPVVFIGAMTAGMLVQHRVFRQA